MKTSTAFLKSHLSEILDRVVAGETVVVTRRGRTIARLVPPPEATGEGTRLDELEARGLVRRGGEPLPDDFWTRPRPQDADGTTVAGLVEEREQGW